MNLIEILLNALFIALADNAQRCEAKLANENGAYVEFLVVSTSNCSEFYIRWHKGAKYFCDIIPLMMAGTNPIFAEKIANATEIARKKIKNTNL